MVANLPLPMGVSPFSPVIHHSDSSCALPPLGGTDPWELMSPGYLKPQLPDEFNNGYDFVV